MNAGYSPDRKVTTKTAAVKNNKTLGVNQCMVRPSGKNSAKYCAENSDKPKATGKANSESKADHGNLLEIHFGYDATEATVRLKWVDR